MNILFIIGNGFDLNLGLKTRYQDFYEYYKALSSSDAAIARLKKDIGGNHKNWSDLELAFGKYLKNLKSQEEFDLVFEDILDNLGDYLQLEEQKFATDRINQEVFYGDMCFPESYLAKGYADTISSFKDRWQGHEWYLNIITFNYTRIIDNIIGSSFFDKVIGIHHGVIPIKLRGFEHIHGYTDNRMVLGLNDISQLDNEIFHNNQNVLEAFIKSSYNSSQNHLIDKWFENQINAANLICVYGSSLGLTDSIWWNLIGNRLKSNSKLIIFTKGEEISSRKIYKEKRIEREIMDLFISRLELPKDDKDLIKSNIYIVYNSSIFCNLVNKS